MTGMARHVVDGFMISGVVEWIVAQTTSKLVKSILSGDSISNVSKNSSFSSSVLRLNFSVILGR